MVYNNSSINRYKKDLFCIGTAKTNEVQILRANLIHDARAQDDDGIYK
jgi:hypothetical protein